MKGLIVLLLLVSVIKCNAMSKHEIEEFTNFLRRASSLDQNLKDGSHAFDEDEEASDHAWEESGKFEGDLILNERQRRVIVEDVAEGLSRNGLKDSTKRWPDNEVIYYIQKEHFSEDQVQAIQDGIDDLSRASCVKFKPYKKGNRDAVVIQGSRRGCFSQVGYQGGYQVLNLSARHPVGKGCFRHGTVVHEMLHTLGFYHMQSSPDRDDYIQVKWENIVEPAKHNFRKYNLFSVSDFGVGYDYDSVLHYSRRAFSSNGKPTLVPKQDGARIGQRIGLSDKDTQKLNKMYCDANSNNFEQADNDEPKILKKKGKNLPFQGHGIGYHQGKTVVIKLPAAGTYKLDESTSYPAFDYFSKAPQAVSPTLVKGSGIGKEIAYRPHLDYDIIKTKYDTQYRELKSSTESIEKDKEEVTKENKKLQEDSDASAEYDIKKAFDRLQKTIKSHVYPPTFESDKRKVDYSEYYNPNKKIESIDESKFITEKQDIKKVLENTKTNNENNDEEFNTETLTPVYKSPKYEYNYGETDSSYGTSFPFKKLHDNEEELIKKYSIPSDLRKFDYLENKNNYEASYGTNRKDELPSATLNEPWYILDELKPSLQYSGYINARSPGARLPSSQEKGKDFGTFSSSVNQDMNKNPMADFGYYANPKSLEYLAKKQDYSGFYKPTQINNKEDTTIYTLFGKPVPSTDEWYKTSKKGAPSENKSDNSFESVSDSKKTKIFSNEAVVDKLENDDLKHTSGSKEHDDSSSRSHNINNNAVGNLVKVKEQWYDYTKESVENYDHIPNSTVKTNAYDVTEHSEEYEAKKKKNSSNVQRGNSSTASEEPSSSNTDITERLRGILDSYINYDDFDITSSPFTSHEESIEEKHYIGTIESALQH